MKSLNDLRDEFKAADARHSSALSEIHMKLEGLDERLKGVDGKISKLLWGASGVVLTVVVMVGGWELLTSFFDVAITPKQ